MQPTHATVSRSSRDLLTPSMSTMVLKYHTTPPDRLVAVTVRDLSACGIPARALGRVSSTFRVTLVGCVAVNEHARSYLPEALGGTAHGLDASADTLSLSESSFARSPEARLRPPTPTRSPPPTPLRAALVRAATDAVDAAEAAEDDATGAAAASAAANARRDAAAVELAGAEHRHTRAHPRGSLVSGVAVAARRRAAGTRGVSPVRDGVAAGAGAVGVADAPDREGLPTGAAPAAAGAAAADPSDNDAPADDVPVESGGPVAAGPVEGDGGAGRDGADSDLGSEDNWTQPAGDGGGLGPLPRPSGGSDGSADGRSDDDGDDAVARDTYAALARATEAFEQRGAEAVLACQRVTEALARARGLRAVADSSCSALSASGAARLGSPRAPVDAAREQQSLAASLSLEGLKADVIAGLLGHRKRFPLVMAAMLRRGGGEGARAAALDDLPLLALLPAWQAAQLQEHGLQLLAASATEAAPGAARPGVRAREAFATGAFDLLASEAIDDLAVDIDVAPLDLCAGVLPIAQLALHLWLKFHVFLEAETKELEKLAQGVSFVRDKVLDPHAGLSEFLPAWGIALGEAAEFSATGVYYALLVNLHRDRDAIGASTVHVTVAGVSLNWTAYSNKLTAEWRANGSRSRATRAQLTSFVRVLRQFGDGRLGMLGDALPAPSGTGSASAFVATVALGPTEPSAVQPGLETRRARRLRRAAEWRAQYKIGLGPDVGFGYDGTDHGGNGFGGRGWAHGPWGPAGGGGGTGRGGKSRARGPGGGKGYGGVGWAREHVGFDTGPTPGPGASSGRAGHSGCPPSGFGRGDRPAESRRTRPPVVHGPADLPEASPWDPSSGRAPRDPGRGSSTRHGPDRGGGRGPGGTGRGDGRGAGRDGWAHDRGRGARFAVSGLASARTVDPSPRRGDGTGRGAPGEASAPAAAPAVLPGSCRPVDHYGNGAPCSECRGAIPSHGVFCVPCTVQGPEPRLAPGVLVCEYCQSLFRGVCKDRHHLLCGGYEGASEAPARPVNFDSDSGIILKALSKYTTARFAVALRPHKSRLARAKATDVGANTLALGVLAGLLEAANEGTAYFESLALLARGLEPATKDRLAWAWARDHRSSDARGSAPPQALTVAGRLGQHCSMLGDLPEQLSLARARTALATTAAAAAAAAASVGAAPVVVAGPTVVPAVAAAVAAASGAPMGAPPASAGPTPGRVLLNRRSQSPASAWTVIDAGAAARAEAGWQLALPARTAALSAEASSARKEESRLTALDLVAPGSLAGTLTGVARDAARPSSAVPSLTRTEPSSQLSSAGSSLPGTASQPSSVGSSLPGTEPSSQLSSVGSSLTDTGPSSQLSSPVWSLSGTEPLNGRSIVASSMIITAPSSQRSSVVPSATDAGPSRHSSIVAAHLSGTELYSQLSIIPSNLAGSELSTHASTPRPIYTLLAVTIDYSTERAGPISTLLSIFLSTINWQPPSGSALGAACGAAFGAARGAALCAAFGSACGAALCADFGSACGAALGAAFDAACGAALCAPLGASCGTALGAARALGSSLRFASLRFASLRNPNNQGTEEGGGAPLPPSPGACHSPSRTQRSPAPPFRARRTTGANKFDFSRAPISAGTAPIGGCNLFSRGRPDTRTLYIPK